MVTYLSALRCAVNVEHACEQLQRKRFALRGDTASRALPPLIPLRYHQELPSFAVLDEIRRTHMVTMTWTGSTPAEIPPARVTLGDSSTGPDTERQIVALQQALSAGDHRQVPPVAPQLVISWSEALPSPSPIPLPETSAFWLSVFELNSENDPWWEYLTWTQRYARRLRAP
ncbi:MAG: hypothetical protein ACOCYB_10195 [Alkalispirochaeta sp.]